MSKHQNQSKAVSLQRRVIGLTGGIGMGKTTISDYLAAAHQLPVLDADLYAREAVTPQSHVLQEVVDRYGQGILLPDGSLDRRRLGQIIFEHSSERWWLEQRIHPYVRDRIESQLQLLSSLQYPTVVVVVPLLFEARMTDLVTEIWVVQCPPSQQLERLMQRDGRGKAEGDRLTLDQVKARIDSQMPIERKVACADIVLDNSLGLEALLHQVDQALHQHHITQPKAASLDMCR